MKTKTQNRFVGFLLPMVAALVGIWFLHRAHHLWWEFALCLYFTDRLDFFEAYSYHRWLMHRSFLPRLGVKFLARTHGHHRDHHSHYKGDSSFALQHRDRASLSTEERLDLSTAPATLALLILLHSPFFFISWMLGLMLVASVVLHATLWGYVHWQMHPGPHRGRVSRTTWFRKMEEYHFGHHIVWKGNYCTLRLRKKLPRWLQDTKLAPVLQMLFCDPDEVFGTTVEHRRVNAQHRAQMSNVLGRSLVLYH